jgi:putative heme iron utilization protein
MALTVKHLFPFLKLMKALNVKEEFKNLSKNKIDVSAMTEEEQNDVLQERGMDMMFTIMEKMPNAEKEIKSFLALYSDRQVEEIESLSIDEFIALVKQFFAEPELKSFFKQAAK